MKKILTALALALVLCLGIGIAAADYKTNSGVVVSAGNLERYVKSEYGEVADEVYVQYKVSGNWVTFTCVNYSAYEKAKCLVPVTLEYQAVNAEPVVDQWGNYTGNYNDGHVTIEKVTVMKDHDKSLEEMKKGNWQYFPKWNLVSGDMAVVPTCGDEGKLNQTYRCSNCGAEVKLEQAVVVPANHEFQLVVRNWTDGPSCTGTKAIVDAQCVHCGKYYTDLYSNYKQYDVNNDWNGWWNGTAYRAEVQTELFGQYTVDEFLACTTFANETNPQTRKVWIYLNDEESRHYHGHEYGDWFGYTSAVCAVSDGNGGYKNGSYEQRRYCHRCSRYESRFLEGEKVGPDYVLQSEKWIDCYTLQLTFACKICGNYPMVDKKGLKEGDPVCIHGPITFYLRKNETIHQTNNGDTLVDLYGNEHKTTAYTDEQYASLTYRGEKGMNAYVIMTTESHTFVEEKKYATTNTQDKRIWWDVEFDQDNNGISDPSCTYGEWMAYLCVRGYDAFDFTALRFTAAGTPYVSWGHDTAGVRFVKISDPLGHDFGSWTEVHAPWTDGTAYGLYTRTCKRCKESQTISATAMPADDHVPTAEEIVEDVTKPAEVITGWVKDEAGAWNYLDENGNKVTSAWAGDYYLKADGTMATSAYIKGNGGYWYVGADGKCDGVKYSWKQDETGWWFGGNGWYAANTTIVLDGSSYSFDAAGYLK